MFRGAENVMWARKSTIKILPPGTPIRFRGVELFTHVPEDIAQIAPNVNGITFTSALTGDVKTISAEELREVQPRYASDIT